MQFDKVDESGERHFADQNRAVTAIRNNETTRRLLRYGPAQCRRRQFRLDLDCAEELEPLRCIFSILALESLRLPDY